MRDYNAAGVAAHHLMLAHGLASRDTGAHEEAEVGITLCLQVTEPFSQRPLTSPRRASSRRRQRDFPAAASEG